MRLIDADKLHIKLLDLDFPLCDHDPILDAMDSCTVDAVPVVRCKDCKYRNGMPGQPNILCGQMKDDDYCRYGEKPPQ